MKLQKWALTAEIIGAAAIVVTLVILIVELRGNTDALQAQTITAAYEAEWRRRNTIVSNEGGIAEIIVKGMNEEDLTPVDTYRLKRYYTNLLDTFEYQFGEMQAGRLPADLLNVSNWSGMWRGQPLLREGFERSKASRSAEFVRYWEENVVNR